MWQPRRSNVDATTLRCRIQDLSGETLDFAQVIGLWETESAFRTFWGDLLRESPFAAFAWECRPVSAADATQPFECVQVASPELMRAAQDPEVFAAHFPGERGVACFGNLGGDAMLIAPCPGPPTTDYAHLAVFAATAPPAQQDALWQAVGSAMQRRIGASPKTWLSTAGLGVAWLHVRLDSRPKYYRYAPYARG
jgi:hypothetical protein